MAGMAGGYNLTPHPPRNGMVWDASAGGYVSPVSQSQTSAQNAGNHAAEAQANASAQVAQPMSMAQLQVLQNQAATSAPGYIAPMSAADSAHVALGQGSLAEQQRAALESERLATSTLGEHTREAQASEKLASDKFAATKAMRDQLLGVLGGVGGPGGGATGGGDVGNGGLVGTGGIKSPMGPMGSMSDPDAAVQAAETAALTGSKERNGERLASSLKGLHELMAERGISGSGIEARETGDLYGDYLHGENDTERGIVQQRSARAQSNANAQWTRQNDVDDRNYAAQQQLLHDKISALLSSFGMSY